MALTRKQVRMQILLDASDDDMRIDGQHGDEGSSAFAEEDVDCIEQLQNPLGIARVQS